MDKLEIGLITLINRIQGNKESYKSFSGVIRKQIMKLKNCSYLGYRTWRDISILVNRAGRLRDWL
jgi:hypothetical protein